MTEAPQILLAHHLKTLKLPTFLREYEKQARQCATEGLDHVQFLARLVELELIDRERRMVERRIKAAKFPATKSLDSFDFKAIPKLNSEPANATGPRERANAGAGARPLRLDRPTRERYRPRAERHRKNSCGSWAWAGSMPKGPVRRLHHRRGPG